MLGASSLILKINHLTQTLLSPCRFRYYSVTMNWTRTATKKRWVEAPKDPAIGSSLDPQTTNDSDIGTASKLNFVTTNQGNYVNAVGRFHRRPIKTIYANAESSPDEHSRLLHIIATTQSSEDAWDAYRTLSTFAVDPAANKHHVIPIAHFHRLARLLGSTKPKTRTLFLRLLTVLASLKRAGGNIQTWEWNALIDCAGKGWRKTRPQDFKASLDVYEDMVSQGPPEGDEHDHNMTDQENSTAVAKPDIITYTTLLYIACRTLMPATVRQAGSLLRLSGNSPNLVTHLSMLRYYTRTSQLSGVRATIMRLREQGFVMGIDGINACMTAFMFNSQMDIATTIYRVLRHHVVPEHDVGEHDIDAAIRYLDVAEDIVIGETLIPDRVTYTIIIQGLAYQGDLIQALQVFSHMLSSPDIEPFAPLVPNEDGELVPNRYPTTLPVFRALFLGFARHAQVPVAKKEKKELSTRLKALANPPSSWTLTNLEFIFKSFLELPADTRPSERTIYWILVGFAKTSGRDVHKMQKVWSLLVEHFGGGWGGRLETCRKIFYGELPGADKWPGY